MLRRTILFAPSPTSSSGTCYLGIAASPRRLFATNTTARQSIAAKQPLANTLKAHYEILKKRQEVCPHLYLIKGTYAGVTPKAATPPPPPPAADAQEGEGGNKTVTTDAPLPPPPPVEQQCEWCGKCRTLDPDKMNSSSYYKQRLFSKLQPEVVDEEEPWVDVSYNIHCALKALDLHVMGADDNTASLVTRFLASATSQVSGKAMYQQAEARKAFFELQKQIQKEEQTKREAELSFTTPSTASTESKEGSNDKPATPAAKSVEEAVKKDAEKANKSTGTAASSELKSAVDAVNAGDGGAKSASSDVEDSPYDYANPTKAVITAADLYGFVPHFEHIAKAHPHIPFPKHVTTIPLAVKYFSSVSKKECLAKYLTCETERELGIYNKSSDPLHHHNAEHPHRSAAATTTIVGTSSKGKHHHPQQQEGGKDAPYATSSGKNDEILASGVFAHTSAGRKRFDLFKYPNVATTATTAGVDTKENTNGEGHELHANHHHHPLHPMPTPGTILIPRPTTEFVQSALRACKFCAVVYGTAYERHFFDSILQVGRVRSFLEIYQSSHESQLAAARRMVSSDLGEVDVWSVEKQRMFKNVPSTEILVGNWTNVPWGVTHVIAVDHAHKEITVAFRGTFADAGIVVDIHNGPLSLLTLAEEARLFGRKSEVHRNVSKTNEANGASSNSSPAGKSKNAESNTSSTTHTGEHFTAPFGFVFNIKPGSPQTQTIDKQVLLLALLQYPSYKVVFTGHSLGAAYSSNFAASRLMIGALAKEAGLYDTPMWGELRECILNRQRKDNKNNTTANASNGGTNTSPSAADRPSDNPKLVDLISRIDFNDSIAVAGLYVNGFIEVRDDVADTSSPSDANEINPQYTSTIESRLVVNSFAPPASVNITWRDALLKQYPKLDFRAFVHDTDVVTRLQVPALRVMQQTVNEVIPSVFQRKMQSILAQFVGTSSGSAASSSTSSDSSGEVTKDMDPASSASSNHYSSAASSSSNHPDDADAVISEEAAVFEKLHRHLQKEIHHRRRLLRKSSDDVVAKTGGSHLSSHLVEKDNNNNTAEVDASSNVSPTQPPCMVARSPDEQLANLESLRSCFHNPTCPRAETRDNYWVTAGHIYLLGREGQSYNEGPVKGLKEGGGSPLLGGASSGEATSPSTEEMEQFAADVGMELFTSPTDPAEVTGTENRVELSSTLPTPSDLAKTNAYHDIPDASYDIATAFNTTRRPATMALVQDPLAPSFFVPIIDMRGAQNHFLFRYGRAILDLGAK